MKNYGYEAEVHDLTTPDGYIVTVHRAMNLNFNSSSNSKKSVVLFLHGFLASSDYFILRGPGQDLGKI